MNACMGHAWMNEAASTPPGETDFKTHGFISTVRPTIHSNQSPKRSFFDNVLQTGI